MAILTFCFREERKTPKTPKVGFQGPPPVDKNIGHHKGDIPTPAHEDTDQPSQDTAADIQDAANNNQIPGQGRDRSPPAHLKFLKSSKMKKSHSMQESSSHGQSTEGGDESPNGAGSPRGNGAKVVEHYSTGSPTKVTDHYNYRVQQVIWNKNTQVNDKYRVRDRFESEPSNAESVSERRKRTEGKGASNSDVVNNGKEAHDAKHYGKAGAKHHGNDGVVVLKERRPRTVMDSREQHDVDDLENATQDKLTIVIPPSKYLKSTNVKHHGESQTAHEAEYTAHDAKLSEKTDSKPSIVSKHDGLEDRTHGKPETAKYGLPTYQEHQAAKHEAHQTVQDARSKSRSNFVDQRHSHPAMVEHDFPALPISSSRYRLTLDSGKHPLSTTSETPRFNPPSPGEPPSYQAGTSGSSHPRDATYGMKDNRVSATGKENGIQQAGSETTLETDVPYHLGMVKVSVS